MPCFTEIKFNRRAGKGRARGKGREGEGGEEGRGGERGKHQLALQKRERRRLGASVLGVCALARFPLSCHKTWQVSLLLGSTGHPAAGPRQRSPVRGVESLLGPDPRRRSQRCHNQGRHHDCLALASGARLEWLRLRGLSFVSSSKPSVWHWDL